MEARLERINDRVRGEVAVLGQLLRLMEEEKDILLRGRHQELMGTTERKLALFHRLNQSQAERRTLQEELAEDNQPAPSLGQISRGLPREEQEGFRADLLKADDLARRVIAANQANQGFVAEALATVDHLLGILAGGGQARGYSPQGVTAPPNRPRLLAREV